MPSLVKADPVDPEKEKISMLSMCFHYLPLEKYLNLKLPLIQGLIGLNMVGDVLCPYSFNFSNVYISVISRGEGLGFT